MLKYQLDKKKKRSSLLLGFFAATTSLTAFGRFLVSADSVVFFTFSSFSVSTSIDFSSDFSFSASTVAAFFPLEAAGFFFSGVATLDSQFQMMLANTLVMTINKQRIYLGTLDGLSTGAFLGLAGEGLGLGAFTVLVTAVVSLTIVLVARLVFGGASSSESDVFLALVLAASAGLALTVLLVLASLVVFVAF